MVVFQRCSLKVDIIFLWPERSFVNPSVLDPLLAPCCLFSLIVHSFYYQFVYLQTVCVCVCDSSELPTGQKCVWLLSPERYRRKQKLHSGFMSVIYVQTDTHVCVCVALFFCFFLFFSIFCCSVLVSLCELYILSFFPFLGVRSEIWSDLLLLKPICIQG